MLTAKILFGGQRIGRRAAERQVRSNVLAAKRERLQVVNFQKVRLAAALAA
ncbi:MAG TPA: hypothetical protein VNG33_00905 [Polyangiaceae bacterium]|nr:hypothetical protein [Polyangiaceae bacterium]